MVRISCLLGSPMVTKETRHSWPRQPGRAEQKRLPPPGGRRRPKGGAAREDQTGPLDVPAHCRSARATLPSGPRLTVPLAPPTQAPPRFLRRRLARFLQVSAGPPLPAVRGEARSGSGLYLRARLVEPPTLRLTGLLPRPRSSHLLPVRAAEPVTPSGKGGNLRGKGLPAGSPHPRTQSRRRIFASRLSPGGRRPMAKRISLGYVSESQQFS